MRPGITALFLCSNSSIYDIQLGDDGVRRGGGRDKKVSIAYFCGRVISEHDRKFVNFSSVTKITGCLGFLPYIIFYNLVTMYLLRDILLTDINCNKYLLNSFFSELSFNLSCQLWLLQSTWDTPNCKGSDDRQTLTHRVPP